MKKLLTFVSCVIIFIIVFSVVASAMESYTVVKGDSMWKIAIKYEVGLSEIKSANPQISNPDLIYPGQVFTVPKPE